MGIEFAGVTKRYPDGTVAVDELSLTIEDGSITVFVGPSGRGKTTSLRMINRHPADEFVASFVGRDRGYRALSFVDPAGIETKDVATVTLGERVAGATSDWLLTVNASGRPRGWLPPASTVDGEVGESAIENHA